MTQITPKQVAQVFASPVYHSIKEAGLASVLTKAQLLGILKGTVTSIDDILVEPEVPVEVDLTETLQPLYEYLLDRDADEGGLKFWASILARKEAETTRAEALKFVIEEFTSSPGYKKEVGI